MFFNFIKARPTLKELIPEGFIDIHSHILPGIDDGAKNIEESLVMINEMKKMGFSKIIATPHIYPGLYDNNKKIISEVHKDIIAKNKKDIDITFAAEYMLEDNLIKLAKNNSLLFLKDKYLLIEFSYISSPNNLKNIIFQLQINNCIPILAHPERYLYLKSDKLIELKKRGCKFQLNLLSVTGYYGDKVVKISDFLLKHDLVDFVGSDIHSINHINFFNKKIKINEVESFEKSLKKNNLFS